MGGIIDNLTSDDSLSLSQNVNCLRLQPIINICNGDLVAYEVLAQVENPEIFFRNIPSEWITSFAIWQMSKLSKMPGQYWINMPVRSLKESYFVNKILQIPFHTNLAIEIQDPEELFKLEPCIQDLTVANIKKLKSQGWRIILDDVKANMLNESVLRSMSYYAIKIDRSEIYHPGNIELIATSLRKYAHLIILEGIETEDHLCLAKQAQVSHGQGFLWLEHNLLFHIPTKIDERAITWQSERKNILE